MVCYSIHAAGLNAAPKHHIGTSHLAVSSARTETVRCGRPDEKVTVIPARLIHMVQPKYPKAAERAGVHGTVVLDIVIGIDGHVRDIQYVSGPKALADSAINTVRQWRYSITRLDGKPVMVKSTISVVFQFPK